jgi:hypothetical protein
MPAPTLAPLPPCPAWCEGQCEVQRASKLWHNGTEHAVKLSRGAAYDGRDCLRFTLIGDLGSEPTISFADDNLLGELTIDEAEEMASLLASLVQQARCPAMDGLRP